MTRKPVAYAITIALIIAALILGIFIFTSKPTLPPHEQIYVDCQELMKTDAKTSIARYLHYEDPDTAELARTTAFEIDSYEILEIEQLSDNLWHFYAFIKHELRPNGFYVHHFVGIINNEYRVMFSIDHVPDFLKEDLDPTQYKIYNPDAV